MSQLDFGAGAAITSINADTTAAQVIAGTAPITANTAAGTTTIASTAAANGVAGHITTAAQTLGSGSKTFPAAIIGKSFALTDGATPAINSDNGNTATLNSVQNPTLAADSGSPVDGQKLVIIFTASSSARTLSLTTGSTKAFRFGDDITALSATTSGKSDMIGCIYFGSRWNVVAYVKGFG